jgi:acyl transferase domain-containing protein/surfactin synthase thioesterase subunit/acyl carrier protein
MDRCHALAKPYLEQGLLDVIFAQNNDDTLVNRTDYTQPALFAVEYALAELLKSWGILPDAVIGHSLGELVAACVAGVMTLEDAMRLVAARGALMHRLPSGGAMAAIFAEESVVRALIEKITPDITVAAMNGPVNTVVSGDRDALRMLSAELDRQGISYRELQISNAFHSPRTESILDDLENVAGEIKHNAPRLPLISNLTGELVSAVPDKFYWRRHLREAVRFGDGMLSLAKLECRIFLEIGPHPVLLPLAQACFKGRRAAWIASLNRQKSDADAVTEMLVALYLAGRSVNWTAVHSDCSWRRIPLPTYPFQRKRYWIEDNVQANRSLKAVDRIHPLLGTRIKSTANEVGYESHYGVRHTSYISDHRVTGTIVLPTTAELEAATVVGRLHFGTSRVSFDNAMHHQAMSFANGEDRAVRVVVAPLRSDRAEFKLLSADPENPKVWHTHMTGTLRKSEVPTAPAFSTERVRARCKQTLPSADVYDRLNELGLEYGPSFRGIRELYLGQNETLTRVRLPDGLANTQYVIHPAFLDACLHAYPLVLKGAGKVSRGHGRSYLPVSLEGFRCYQDGVDKAWVHTSLRSVEKGDTQVVDIRVYDEAERPVADLDGLAVRLLPFAKLHSSQASADDGFYRVAWRKSDRDTFRTVQHRSLSSWVIFADAQGIGVALADRLESAGHHCHLVYHDDAFAQHGARTWTVNERKSDDFRRLLEQITAGETLAVVGVAYLWGLDAPRVEGMPLARLKGASEMMCRGALAILHALAETRSANPDGRRLWFVTSNTQKTDARGQHVDPVQAPLWGLGRTAAIEYPGIWGGLIDLDLKGDQTPDIESLVTEFLYPDGETQIAISAGGQRNVPRLVRQSLAELETRHLRIRGDATYLITGGLGMLGRSVAEWLIGRGAKYLVLTGRNARSEAVHDLFAAAETNGTTIEVVAADISREEDVSNLMQRIGSKLPPLKGVVHSAGVLDDGILAQLHWDRFARLFEAKVYGSWLLHEHTKSLDLDFFVLKSSLLSLLGSAGQGNYSAGNTFLDSLAAHRGCSGLPAIVVNWSAWSGGGLATAAGSRGEAMWSSLGVKFIPPDLAMEAFDKLMHHDVDQIAVALADWPIYASKVGKTPFLAELMNGTDDFRSAKFALGKNGLATPAAPADSEPRERLLNRLQRRIMTELGFVDPIDPDRPLNEVGLDSLRSVTLANNLEDEFGVLISISELISGPTINQLVDHLSGLLAQSVKNEITEFASPIMSAATIAALPHSPSLAAEHVSSRIGPAEYRIPHSRAADVLSARDQLAAGAETQQGDDYSTDETATRLPEDEIHPGVFPGVGGYEKAPFLNGRGDGPAAENSNGSPVAVADAITSRNQGRWLIAPRPNPNAKARLFCFPFAGGGLVSFRAWGELFNDTVEVVAVEAPGRGTRINEAAVDDIDVFVTRLLPEMLGWLDRPSAFFGHCLGGLTMYATLCALPNAHARFIKHAFACGVRPPHLLKRRGEFEDNMAYDMMLHRDFDARLPPYAQTDEIFADIIRQFDTPAANKMLEISRLRKVLLPTIRAEFGMAYKYEYRPIEPFAFPISSFVGDADPWVSEKDSARWGDLTRGGFINHVCQGSHFLMAEDGDYILDAINKEFVSPMVSEKAGHSPSL